MRLRLKCLSALRAPDGRGSWKIRALQVAVKKNDARGRREDPGWAAILGGILLLILLTATLGCRTRVDAPVEEGTLGSQSEAVTNTTADNLPPVDDRCMQDIYDKFGQGGALTCTANDVSVAAVSNVTVLDDGCRFVGDTVTFNADIDVQVTASTRHDVGVYLGSHGDALHGECKIATLPVAPNNEACTGAGVPFACCTGKGNGTCRFVDADGTGDDTNSSDSFGYCAIGGVLSTNPATPCNENADCAGGAICQEFSGKQDRCGDIVSGARNPIRMTLTSITLQCADADGRRYGGPTQLHELAPTRSERPLSVAARRLSGGAVEVPVSVRQRGEHPRSQDNRGDQGSSCRTPTRVSSILTVDNGPVEKPNAGDNGTTGKVAVQAGPHSVKQSAGAGTADLTRYASSITCVDRVGRCTGNASRHCLTDFACDVVGAGSCNLTPTQVASCTNCTTLAVTVPGTQSDIVCTITNTRVNPCDPAPNCSAFNTACGVASCDPNGAVGNCSVLTPIAAGTVCRKGSGDICDPDEVCDGVQAGACPADVVAPTTTVCNTGSGDVCDPDESCTGLAGQACPEDKVASATTVCNPGSGDICDPDELCPGIADAACPTDTTAPAMTVCRPGSGDLCDPTEVCTGVADAACPPDVVMPVATVCNTGSGDLCDPDERCTGIPGVACPTDMVAGTGVVCRPGSGDMCDPDESCTGVADVACPPDVGEVGRHCL